MNTAIANSSAVSAVQPKAPASGAGWARAEHLLARPQAVSAMGYPWAAWAHPANGMLVISAVEKPDPEPGEFDAGPEYHLSVSAMGRRCSTADAIWALGQFDLLDAKEDNHTPSGRVRNFWRPVADPLSGFECPCQDSEPAMREDKGDFIWRGVSR